MTPRNYLANRQVVTPLPQSKQVASPLPPQPWEDGQLLHDLKDAAIILTGQLGTGYSYDELRRAVRSGQWQEGYHWWKKGRRFKINVRRIIEWQLSA